jgi:hypothetical protein
MEDRKLQRLKEVLSIPTHSRYEELMIEYLKEVLTEKGYVDVSNPYDYDGSDKYFTVDKIGNIYVTKGEAEFFPCFVAHTDTVHRVNHNLKVVQLEEEGKTILTGIDSETMRPSGIGGDDKCGVFLCLEMLDTLDNVKVALFVSEEIGCVGSRQADPEFFSNVGYAIQYDSPKGNSMSMTLMGEQLFTKEGDFGQKVSGLILEHGITDWARHPFTDIWPLMEKFKFSCLNLAAGYHRYHTDNEYVVVEEVQNAFELGLKIHEQLGENFYVRKDEVKKKDYSYSDWFSNDGKSLIVEEEDSEYWEDVEFEEDDNDFEDKFDYEEFNGGYTIQRYGTEQQNYRDRDLGYGWVDSFDW